MISLRKKLKSKWITLFSVAVVIAVMTLAFPLNITPINEGYSGDGSVITITKGENRIVIGNTVGADTADYTCDGTNDDVQFQAAMTALPTAGGQIWVEAGTYNWAALTTVTRAIDNVSIIGVGGGVDFNTDDVTDAFSAGGDYWLFANLQVDAGGIDMGATTDWMWLNVEVAGTYYSVRTDSINIEDHSALHESGGADAIKIDDLAGADDNTDLDSTVAAHGLMPKLGGGTTNFFRADGAWAAPAGGGDVTGPGSSTDEAIARFHETSGKVIQDYTSDAPTISDTGDVSISGDIAVTGTVDGRDVSGIEAGATADQTGAEIKTAYEGEANTNAFTDAEQTKLGTVDTNADVTGDNAPQSHSSSHENAGGDEISAAGLSGLLADDQHVLDAEVQAIKLDDFATPDDNTDLDASLTEHGLLLKLGGGTTNFLRADGTWAAPAGGGDVSGPASSTDNAIVRFDETTGKIVQDYTSNPPTISDTGDITVDGDLTADNIITAGNVDGVDVSTHSTATTGVHGVGAETILHTGDIDSSIQAWDDDLDDLAGLTPTDSYFIVGDNSDWITETGATVRTSLGLTIDTDVPSQSAFDDHSARHIVAGTDTIFPVDPNADRYLMWDDAPTGELVWSSPAGGGDVTGPASSTDNAIVRFDETTGKIIQDYTSNPPTISDTGDMTIDGDATVDNLITAGNVDGVDVSAHAARHTDGNDDIQDAAADDSTKGIATFEADDFDSASGKIDLADSVARSFSGDSGSATPSLHVATIAGGTGITTSATGATVTITGDDATTSTKGIASFDTQHFTVTAGAVDLNIDDTPVDDETDEPITSNWAFDHDADGSAHQSNVISITIIIDGGGSAISTGEAGHLEIPFACTITGWTLLGDQSGSIVIDVWNDDYAAFPPTVADTIAGSEKPTLSTAQKNQDLTLSTWTTAITAGDILAFNVDSAATVERITLSIRATKT